MNAPHKPERPEFADLPDLSQRPESFGTAKIFPPGGKTEEERESAWRRFVAFADEGYVSDGTKMSRDEMNERW